MLMGCGMKKTFVRVQLVLLLSCCGTFFDVRHVHACFPPTKEWLLHLSLGDNPIRLDLHCCSNSLFPFKFFF